MSIGELAAQTGTRASTIRYWEKVGVLPEPGRVSGQRRYSPEAVQRVAVLQLAQGGGFSLEEMRRLLHGFGAGVGASRRWQELALNKRREIDEQIVQLNAMRRLVDRVSQCRCVDLFDCGRIAAAVLHNS